jgi:hypothetical protein
VLSPRTDVVSKVRQYLSELDPEKANLFMTLMRDQRAQRCLVHSTLGFPSAITPNNAEQLLEEVRLSVAAEVRAGAERREAELKRDHDETLAKMTEAHREDVLAREVALLALRSSLDEHKTLATNEINRRTTEISKLGERLRSIEEAVDSDVDGRVQRAATSARRATSFLKAALIGSYLVLVGCAYWFTPGDRLYALGVTVGIAALGFWIIPEVAFQKLARPFWRRRLQSRCEGLGVSEHLRRYDVDEKRMRVTKK